MGFKICSEAPFIAVLAFLPAPSAQMHIGTAARRFAHLSSRLRTSERCASVLRAAQSCRKPGSRFIRLIHGVTRLVAIVLLEAFLRRSSALCLMFPTNHKGQSPGFPNTFHAFLASGASVSLVVFAAVNHPATGQLRTMQAASQIQNSGSPIQGGLLTLCKLYMLYSGVALAATAQLLLILRIAVGTFNPTRVCSCELATPS